ncbi:winged helix-turn-helix domain-containing protein [Streptomyces spectabilis]|uniref:Winged helix-turn helix domain-containing protein n=1 Tax=Streptomyces spectabilis TaxID=68270 RepID=A0A7W8EZG6_STRST|nr:winged helix-turn-helix domain-containing protein [Streptomyces spectabilis]MBB5109901.1 hypothetical protein [Streptomyces spectabilis]
MTTLIGRTFHVSYSGSGATRLTHRLGFTPQVAERDEQAVKVWKEATWAEAKSEGGLRGPPLLRGQGRLHPQAVVASAA